MCACLCVRALQRPLGVRLRPLAMCLCEHLRGECAFGLWKRPLGEWPWELLPTRVHLCGQGPQECPLGLYTHLHRLYVWEWLIGHPSRCLLVSGFSVCVRRVSTS